jgi:hypothetical protein
MNTKVSVPRDRNDKAPVVVEFNFGETLDDAAALFREDVVRHLFILSAKAQLREFVRGMVKGSATYDEIDESVAVWTPVIKTRGKSKLDQALEIIKGFSTQERGELADLLVELSVD